MRRLLALFVVISPMSAFAADGFRCPDTGRLVSLGRVEAEVVARCRQPDFASEHTETRRRYQTRVVCGRTVTDEYETQVVIDDWTYDFGDDRFVRSLRFENGVLVAVAEGGYGSQR